MAFFGFRAYPTPILKPMWPFFIAAGVVFYGVNKLQDMAVSTEEASKDPRNPPEGAQGGPPLSAKRRQQQHTALTAGLPLSCIADHTKSRPQLDTLQYSQHVSAIPRCAMHT
ncbi:hypothetical protein PaG_00200 [Moesziomyces aphidis]|uniref:Uncharacterized protein n=1 Tax=Moesziomyces aphidis TaxID=84754 RepID=W3VWD5_MOEAP|nr:hypothetical protein PaG_00200 [Moesziomyces aphidis]